MNRGAFFDALRATLFTGGLKQTQVDALDAILTEAESRGTPPKHLAYILATAYHEPGPDMQPREENLWYSTASRIRAVWPSHFPSTASAEPFAKNPKGLANKVYAGRMGNLGADDGWTYRGRGLVQITGRDNYRRAGAQLGIPLEENPDQALDMGVAIDVLFAGMSGGWFTGVSLEDAEAVPGYVDDRRIVNGTDKAILVASYARAFETALTAAGYAAGPPPVPGEVPGYSEEDIAALRALAAWWGQMPPGAAAWLKAMPEAVL